MVLVSFGEHRARSFVPGHEGLLRRIRDVIDRGRLDIGQVRLGDVLRWLLGRARGSANLSLAELCAVLEAGARLALLKARRLAGFWEPAPEEEVAPWLGPPPELPLRRSWLAGRFAAGPLSFAGPPRAYEGVAPSLVPIDPHDLRAAMLAVFARAPRPTLAPVVTIERMPVDLCARRILEEVAAAGEVYLSGVAGRHRDAYVAAFLACLMLVRQGRIALLQDGLFGEVVIRLADEALEVSA